MNQQKMNWNVAVEQIRKKNFRMADDFMHFAWEFHLYREVSRPILESQKLCILTRVLCAIESYTEFYGINSGCEAHDAEEYEQKDKILSNALSEIDKCRKICSKIAEMKRREIVISQQFSEEVQFFMFLIQSNCF